MGSWKISCQMVLSIMLIIVSLYACNNTRVIHEFKGSNCKLYLNTNKTFYFESKNDFINEGYTFGKYYWSDSILHLFGRYRPIYCDAEIESSEISDSLNFILKTEDGKILDEENLKIIINDSIIYNNKEYNYSLTDIIHKIKIIDLIRGVETNINNLKKPFNFNGKLLCAEQVIQLPEIIIAMKNTLNHISSREH